MPGPDRNAILKEMGITQWVLRDASPGESRPEQEGEPEKLEVSAVTHKPVRNQHRSELPLTDEPDVMPSVTGLPSLESLRAEVAGCTACELAQSRTNTVFGEGPERADWLFVGEAPGQQEDLQGKPFVGRAGSLLTQMLRALGQTRDQVFIANTLKCRPPNNRDPLPNELKACERYLLKQLELVQPKVIVALGRFSAQTLVGSDQSLTRLRGRVYHYGPAQTPLIVTYHPAYLLRQPADKGKVWADLLLAHRQLPV